MAVRPKLRRRRRTKIIATLGPASSEPELLARLFQAGADVFRLNFSHGTHEDHAKRFAMIRELEEKSHPELREVKPQHWVATWNAANYAEAKPTEPRLSFRRPHAGAVVTAV